MDLNKLIKICSIGFGGGFSEGFIGFGLYFSLFLFLLSSQRNLKNTIATCGFLTIFIGLIFTLHSMLCTSFHWISFISLFFIMLLVGIGAQFLLVLVISKNISSAYLNSTLITLGISIMGMCLVFLCTSLALNWSRFGFETIAELGKLPRC